MLSVQIYHRKKLKHAPGLSWILSCVSLILANLNLYPPNKSLNQRVVGGILQEMLKRFNTTTEEQLGWVGEGRLVVFRSVSIHQSVKKSPHSCSLGGSFPPSLLTTTRHSMMLWGWGRGLARSIQGRKFTQRASLGTTLSILWLGYRCGSCLAAMT